MISARLLLLKFDQELFLEFLNLFLQDYPTRDKNLSVNDFCSTFIMKYKEQLNEHVVPKVPHLREFLYNFLGYSEQWGASTKSFGKNSKILADQITEQDLIKEMTDSKKSLKKLLNASGGDLSAVKPFLPALMISLKTNTRDNSKMQYKHTGEFCFDFDKFKDTEEALFWMKKVYEGTRNIKPYIISHRSYWSGKSNIQPFKIFFN